jgi:hypothetical protein
MTQQFSSGTSGNASNDYKPAYTGGNGGNVVQVVPGKTDKELAAEFKQRLAEVHGPVCALLDEMHLAGFEAQVGCGMGPLGRYVISNLAVFKKF